MSQQFFYFLASLVGAVVFGIIIVLLWLFAPLRDSKGGEKDEQTFLKHLLLSAGGGWATVMLLVVWFLPNPGFDQMLALPLVGAIAGAGLVLWAHDQQWVERLRWRYEMYRQTRGRKTR